MIRLLPPGIWDNPQSQDLQAYNEFVKVWLASESSYRKHFRIWHNEAEPEFVTALFVYDQFGSGGLLADGAATENVIYNQETSGGVVVGGIADEEATYNLQTSGVVLVDGLASPVPTYNYTPQGGVLAGGIHVQTFTDFVNMTGGLLVGGVADEDFTDIFLPTGGILGSGIANEAATYNPQTYGGVLVSGAASFSPTYNYTPQGGVLVSGDHDQTFTDFVDMTGGVVVSGEAPNEVSGDYDEFMTGGVLVSGDHDQTFTDFVDMLGGVIVSGEVDAANKYDIQTSGGVVVSGEGIPGGVVVNGSATETAIYNPESGSCDYKDVISPDAPTNWWRLNDIATAAANSGSVGVATTGTYGSSVTQRVDGLVADNKAALFNATTNDYVDIPDHASVNIGDRTARTVEAWFETDSTARQVIWQEGGTSNGMNLYVEDGNLHYAAWSDDDSWGYSEVTTAINEEQIYYAVLVLDCDNELLRAYLDGESVGTTAIGTTWKTHSGVDA